MVAKALASTIATIFKLPVTSTSSSMRRDYLVTLRQSRELLSHGHSSLSSHTQRQKLENLGMYGHYETQDN
jgi:hypothetical protein